MAIPQQSAHDLPPGLIEKNIILHIQACQDSNKIIGNYAQYETRFLVKYVKWDILKILTIGR